MVTSAAHFPSFLLLLFRVAVALRFPLAITFRATFYANLIQNCLLHEQAMQT